MILAWVEEAVRSGSRLEPACQALGLTARTIQRWRGGGGDGRHGPKSEPPNKLSEAERKRVLAIVNSPRYCDLSPNQIVPRLADEENTYVASEATIYRILRAEEQLTHRERSKPAAPRGRPQEHVATGPCQVFSWDITYLRSPVRGSFFYLYLILDVWSRKIMGACVYREESMDLASELFEQTCHRHGLDPKGIVLHSDNGGPMKGSTMLATLERLAVVASFSRPRVSDDNPYSEALFRTLKYRPGYPSGPFESLKAARSWVEAFVRWYNTDHLHSAIRFVTPDDRHYGREPEILDQRRRVYERARQRNPRRWAGSTRNWNPVEVVYLNPEKPAKKTTKFQEAA